MNRLGPRLLATAIFIATGAAAYEDALLQQVDDNDWRAAEITLQRAEDACRQADNAQACADKVRFSQAWTYTRRAAGGGPSADDDLQKARDSYLAILRGRPTHLATIDNLTLVLEQLEDVEGLRDMLARLRRIGDSKRSSRLSLSIADLRRDAGDARDAYAYYRDAYALERSQRALGGMIAAFLAAPDRKAADELMALATGPIDASMRARLYEAVLRARAAVSAGQWETAAIEWVATLGKERSLDRERIERVNAIADGLEFAELAQRLRNPYLGLEPDDLHIGDAVLLRYLKLGWWNESLARTWAFAIAGWSEGHNRLLVGDFEAANSIWLAALQFAPPADAYNKHSELEGRWGVSLELLTDLARIQWLYRPRLDPQGERFAQVEKVLFFSKAQAYRINDLEAIQRHHSVMGKMYADLGQFSESSNGVRSAEFQLTHALQTADKLGQVAGIAAPQPLLSRLLADGYSCKLPAQLGDCRSQTARAQPLYLQAAQEFIKLDAIDAAATTLQNVSVTDSQSKIKVEQLNSLIDLRAAVTTDLLVKGDDHPDVLDKQIDIANQWQQLGDSDRARVTIDRILIKNAPAADRSEVYRQLDSGNLKSLKLQTLQSIQTDAIR